MGCPTLSRSLRRVGPASQCFRLLCRFAQAGRKKQVLDAENPAPVQLAGAGYLNAITPNKPFTLLFGPAVKNSWFVFPLLVVPPPKSSPQS